MSCCLSSRDCAMPQFRAVAYQLPRRQPWSRRVSRSLVWILLHSKLPTDFKSSFYVKVIEKLILAQLSRYLAANNLFPDYQSGFRRHHSTVTAILRVLSDIYAAIDRDQVSLLALLDVSAAFDTVDHSILLERLSTSYGLSGMALAWLSPTSLDVCRSSMLVDASLPPPRFILASLRVQS